MVALESKSGFIKTNKKKLFKGNEVYGQFLRVKKI